jgi:metallo-beta-lactamase class B
MKRNLLVLSAIALLLAASLAAQGGGARGQRPTGIVRGADQPDQNKWNAKGPWGKTERSAPIEAQQKEPFKVFDNVYYVGFQTVSSYLVTTSDGPVLIDAGYAPTVDWLLESIRKTGNDPKKIKYIFVTHSHVDHASGAARMKQETGARVGLSAEDWTQVERQQSSPQGQRQFPMPIQRDLVLKDGEAIKVGDQTFTFYFTPGHTPGAMSIEFQARDGARSYRTLIPGGLGLHYQKDWGPTFKKSIEKLKALGPWDATLGNHPFLAPKDLEVVEMELKTRAPNSQHPAVLGPARITAFLDAILKIVDEKLIAEPPAPLPATN